MRNLFYFSFISIGLACMGCTKAYHLPAAQVVKPVPAAVITNFTLKDADTAYTAFNNYFYNPANKLYYNATDKSGVGAIWTQAIYWDLAMDVYERTKASAQLTMVNDIYAGGVNQYDNYNWNNTTTWFIYDDMMWWVTALARANQLTGNAAYLQNSIAGFNHVWAGSYDPVDGGMFWDFQHSGKNACINYPTVIAAVRLYQITKDTSYLSKAKSIYAWSKANLFNATSGEVADHKIGNNPPGYQDYTYNQGTAIGAGVMLYDVTKDASYLADAELAADYTQNSMCTNGILPAEGDFNEQGVLKAIFAQYIMMLINDGGQKQYLSWIQQNANTAWTNRDKARNLTYRNYAVPCPTGIIQSYEASSGVTFMQICPPSQ
ncbi:glycoside hydrolase family 76 protein [Mucilaginibacter sp. BJC16-A38]|uniref:glycoside hydrolase family 76 protein n=1 Tax=Mucilaginibacter phenanthrenivorans TaxID=1234842 RepID=UPI00215751E6|nr:glycoside hydrolase family 76 protein [Mucilaginibacter phenanthrenivorans]MCR8557608.1 glycoside hydrolase family 76 protein [Mucilaginibacter phenanthrenivorans]